MGKIIKRQLLVEGKDDQHVIWALCKKFSVSQTFHVVECGGFEKLIEEIPSWIKAPENEAIGIIVDADHDLRSRWESIKSILKGLGILLQEELPKEGLVHSTDEGKDKRIVGVWIMPNNNSNGMLEDFISLLVPKDDKLMPIVDATLEDIERKNLNKYKAIHKSKAKIHTWLSWQENPGTPLGAGITKQIVATDSETCTQLVSWLKRLFEN